MKHYFAYHRSWIEDGTCFCPHWCPNPDCAVRGVEFRTYLLSRDNYWELGFQWYVASFCMRNAVHGKDADILADAVDHYWGYVRSLFQERDLREYARLRGKPSPYALIDVSEDRIRECLRSASAVGVLHATQGGGPVGASLYTVDMQKYF